MNFDGAEPGVLAAILAMAAATYLMRAGGFWLMAHIPMTRRVRQMLEALPGSIVAATVLPVAVKSGPSGLTAIAAVALVMALRGNEFLAIAAGLLVAAALRACGL